MGTWVCTSSGWKVKHLFWGKKQKDLTIGMVFSHDKAKEL